MNLRPLAKTTYGIIFVALSLKPQSRFLYLMVTIV